MPKISVLMGAYNCADTIEASIKSIQSQTFADWELIICDDGSFDNTAEIIRKLQKDDERIVLIKNDSNKGLSYTLNHCLRFAKGEYCARMDGDDLCDSSRLKKQYDFLETHTEYAFVSTTMKRFDEKVFNGEVFARYSRTIADPVKARLIVRLKSLFCSSPRGVSISATSSAV